MKSLILKCSNRKVGVFASYKKSVEKLRFKTIGKSGFLVKLTSGWYEGAQVMREDFD